MSVLVPCPGCRRHVRSSEASCPFCANALPADLAAGAVPSNRRRLDRIATFTFAAAIAIAGSAATGCSSGDDGSDETEDRLALEKDKEGDAEAADAGCRPEEDFGGMVALYGAPPTPPVVDDRPPCANADAGAPPDDDAGSVAAMYGLPPSPPNDDGNVQPMYGLPAADGGS